MATCPHCSNEFDPENSSQPCCECGHPLYCGCSEPREYTSKEKEEMEALEQKHFENWLRQHELEEENIEKSKRLIELRKHPSIEIQKLINTITLINNLSNTDKSATVNIVIKILELSDSEKTLLNDIHSLLKNSDFKSVSSLTDCLLDFYDISEYRSPTPIQSYNYDLPDF